jgi:putative phosphoribosyl transferase
MIGMKKKVSFKNNKGFELVANIIGIEQGENHPVVIFTHDLNDSKDNPFNFSIAERLVEKGFYCFLFDFSGHGESDGEISGAAVEQFIQDIDTVLNYVDNIKKIDPMRIGIYGSNTGGIAALIKAITDGRIRTLALYFSSDKGYHEHVHKVNIPVLIVREDSELNMKEHLKKAKETVVQWFVEKLGLEDSVSEVFKDRKDAGLQLASNLENYRHREEVMVLSLPRGGVITGYEIASSLHCPLDIIIVRKLNFPGQPELAIGAVSERGTVVLNESIISAYSITEEYIKEEISRQKSEIERKIRLYRKDGKIPELAGRIIILVDDGVATGATMKAAISMLKMEDIAKLIVALPVAPPGTAAELRQMVDEFICLEIPPDFMAVGSYYQDFVQIGDEEVIEILRKSKTGKEGA